MRKASSPPARNWRLGEKRMRYGEIRGIERPASVICLGTGSFGTSTPRDRAFELLDQFAELGGNFLDSAHIYAAWVPGGQGASERTIGEWMASRGVRDRIIVGTKGAHPEWGSTAPRLGGEHIRQDLTESLERLQTDFVDLYWLHRDDAARPVDEIIDALEAEADAGRIGAYGCSNWRWDRIQAANDYAQRTGKRGFVASQPEWNLAHRTPSGDATMMAHTRSDVEEHERTGLACIPYSSQARGFFGGVETEGVRNTYANEVSDARLARARDMAERQGWLPSQVALAYLVNHPFPAFPIIGTSNPEHLETACSASDFSLTPEEVAWLRDGE